MIYVVRPPGGRWREFPSEGVGVGEGAKAEGVLLMCTVYAELC